MRILTLQRELFLDDGTFGTMKVGDLLFHTGELPWRMNQTGISCIPIGKYVCQWTMSKRLGRECYEVTGVQDRIGIRFHPANFMGDVAKGLKSEVNGCIALGSYFGRMSGQWSLKSSKDAMLKFEILMQQEPFVLEIINNGGGEHYGEYFKFNHD